MTVIGIDLGTTNSCVEIFHDNKTELITNDRGNRRTPSIVAFTDEGILIGDSAKDQMVQNPENTIYDIKFFLGRKYTDEEIEETKSRYPFKIVSDRLNRIQFEVQLKGKPQLFYPEEVAAMLLSKLNSDAEKYLDKKVTGVVISVPTFSSTRQRQAVLDAAHIANLNVLSLLNETTAAAEAQWFDERREDESKSLFINIGGGTTDVTLMDVCDIFIEPLATSGDTTLGGRTFNDQLLKYIIKFLKEKSPNMKIFESPQQIGIIRDLIEKAKIELSTETTAEIEFDESLFEGNVNKIEIPRSLFDKLNEEYYNSIIDHIKTVLKFKEITKDDVTDVFLTGGSSEIPQIRKIIEEFFGKEKLKTFSIDQDEIVAVGAAIHAAYVLKQYDDLLVIDISSIPIGIERGGNIMCFYFPQNTSLYYKRRHIFTTFMDWQKEFRLDIFEGFRSMSLKNELIETLVIPNLPPVKCGKLFIEITFFIDLNGILNTSAKIEIGDKHIDDVVLKHVKKAAFSEIDIEKMKEKLSSMMLY